MTLIRGAPSSVALALPLLLLIGCPAAPGPPAPPDSFPDDDDLALDDDDSAVDDDDVADDDDDDTDEPACPDGVICVDQLPFVHTGDTSSAPFDAFDSYSCAPDLDESGPEFVYRVEVPSDGFLSAGVDVADPDVDIDVHLLWERDEGGCVDRGHWNAAADVEAGTWWIVTDTWVDASGAELAGEFTLGVGLTVPAAGDCSVESGWLDRVGDGGVPLQMPATGPIVMEAHLVTVDDGYGALASDPWPQSITEGIEVHHAVSQAATGLVMHRSQPWAPQEGCEFGQAAHYHKLPVLDEGWYVNMYWQDRPDPGTRMIVADGTGRALVAAAGYETGPGNLEHVGGTTEEVHHYFGTGHLSELTLGFAVDQDLPLGPIVCW